MNTKIYIIVFGLFILFAAVFGCRGQREDVIEDEVLATIDGMTIMVSEFKSAIEKLKTGISTEEGIDEERARVMKINLLNQLIEKKILTAEAEKLGITVSPEEIDAEVQNIIGEYPDSKVFNEKVKEIDIDIDQWRKEIEYKILLGKLIEAVASEEIEITPEEVKEYYDEHRYEYDTPKKVRALQIMVETRAEADMVMDMIVGGEDFSELAKTYSISPDSAKGGDLGYFSIDEMPPDFAIVFDMKPEELSDVVESPYGFHIFKVIDIREAKDMTLSEAREDIEGKLKEMKIEEQYGNWFNEIMSQTKIEIDPAVLEKIVL
jgi:parvulin-like peptidyl-prolyl isomerase